MMTEEKSQKTLVTFFGNTVLAVGLAPLDAS